MNASTTRERVSGPYVPSDFNAALVALANAGVSLTLTDAGKIRVSPESAVSDTVRAIVAAHRPALVEQLQDQPRFGALPTAKTNPSSRRCVFCDEAPCSCEPVKRSSPSLPTSLPHSASDSARERNGETAAQTPHSAPGSSVGDAEADYGHFGDESPYRRVEDPREAKTAPPTATATTTGGQRERVPYRILAASAVGETRHDLTLPEAEQRALLRRLAREWEEEARPIQREAVAELLADLEAGLVPEWITIPGRQANGRADLAPGSDVLNRERSTCGPRRYLRELTGTRDWRSNPAAMRDVVFLAFWWRSHCRTYGKSETAAEAAENAAGEAETTNAAVDTADKEKGEEDA